MVDFMCYVGALVMYQNALQYMYIRVSDFDIRVLFCFAYGPCAHTGAIRDVTCIRIVYIE